jgi:CRP-like cAMP-binding protein
MNIASLVGRAITGEPRNATVRALGAVDLYSLDAISFRSAVESSATFGEPLRSIFFQRR